MSNETNTSLDLQIIKLCGLTFAMNNVMSFVIEHYLDEQGALESAKVLNDLMCECCADISKII